MPSNTLDLFVENRQQTICFSNIENSHGENIGDIRINFDSFSASEFARLEIIVKADFQLEAPEWYFNTSGTVNILDFINTVSQPRRHQDYELIVQFVKIMKQNNLLFDVHNHLFVYYTEYDTYVVLSDETFAGTGVQVVSHTDNCRWCIIDAMGNEGYSATEEYVYYGENCYVNDVIAEAHGINYCSQCDEYREGECESCNTQGEQFDYTVVDKYDSPSFVQLTGVSGMKYTFGVELETCRSSSVYPNDMINWKAVYDGSTSGLEYVSGVLQGNKGLKTIQAMCTHLNDYDARVDKTCGVHIHIGDAIFNRRFSIMVLKLCLAIEDDIYKMLPQSRQINSYCKRLPKEQIERMNFHNYKDTLGKIIQNCIISRQYNKKKNHPGGHYNSERYYWVNITNYSTTTGTNTIEFRPHSGSLDYRKIYNWLLVCMSIVKFAENQQRRIWTSTMSKNRITLQEVLRYSLNDKLYKQAFDYCNSRTKQFASA